jgi:OmcA/MtrC family decaheme c-type cytochrome
MKIYRSAYQWVSLVALTSMLAIALTGCSGDDGSQGPPGPPGTNVGVASLSEATSLTINITSVTINSAPVVNFTVTNQDGVPVSGFGAADLRFNIAKLVPGTSGGPSRWQNYINRASSGAVQGTQERASTGGTLVDNKNGTFTYTFAADITNPTANPCPAPCTDADGNALDISYQPSLVHRVTIQQGNSAYPQYNATYTFVPGGGEVASGREIVQTATCNQCHNKISAHGSRIETKLCVTCHNPGSWVKGTPGVTPNTPVDFKVMIHKIHQGEELPSVKAGVPYKIGSADFSDVVFPYSSVALGDTRACTKCHDGSAAQSDNWKNQPSKPACGACHDDVYFGDTPDPLKPYQTVRHADAGLSGTVDPADSTCTLCHGVGRPADVVVKHDLPNLLTAEGAKYQFSVVSAANTAPSAPGGAAIQVVFSVKNPATGTAYNIKTDPAFACVPGTGLPASVSMLVGWNNTDENNTGSASNPGQPYSASVLDTYSGGVCSNNANVTGPDGSGNFTLTLTGKVIPLAITGSGRAALYGRTSKDVDGDGTKENVRIKAAYKDFAITDPTPVARRTVVDIAKCDKCHDSLSLHGDARTDEPGLCVICHNPSATDVTRRPKGVGTGGLFPDATLSLDGKAEEAIDFKRLIHGVHAAAKTDYTGAAAEGFRTKGLVVWGYPGAGSSTCTAPAYTCQNDFSRVRFPGILNDCLTCHVTPTGNNRGSYELAGKWEVPTASGILGSTISTVPDLTGVYATQLADQTDDLNITPTAAVCSSCHDSATAKSHMQLNGALFAATQAVINTGVTLEACAICHGPGRLADVKVMHGVK